MQPRLTELRSLAEQIHAHRTPGTDRLDLEGTTNVPVAAHQDGNLVWHTLQGHVDSLGSGFSPRTQLLLSLNAPLGTKERRIEETREVVEDFAHDNPDFPMSYYVTEYPEHTPVGTIRGDLADSGLFWATRVSGLITPTRKDLAIITNDIDERARDAGYETNMLDTLALPGTIAARGLMAYDKSGLRNVDNLFEWFALPVKAGAATCEANFAYNAQEGYLGVNGYDRQSKDSETGGMVARSSTFKTAVEPVKTAQGSLITSSNRHILEGTLNGIPPWAVDMELSAEATAYRSEERMNQLREAADDVSDKDYAAWTAQYQRDILRYGGAVRYRRGGPEALEELARAVEEARSTLGGGQLDEGEVERIFDEVVANTEWIHRPKTDEPQ